ncbi:MAG: VOC family protein [Cyclobacteriaceae bacterium]
MIKKLSAVLWTDKLEESVEFYTHILLFECDALNESAGWAKMRKGEAIIMLSKPQGDRPFVQPAFTGSLYLNSNNVMTEWDLMKDLAEICYPITQRDYGMLEFAIYDNNGYVIQFGQAVEK